jgi:iron complex outermembrane receptor protein
LFLRALLPLFSAFFCPAQQADPDLQNTLRGLSLEQLGNIEVTSVSKSPVTVTKTPAAVYVITQQDIRRAGVTSLPEALRLAPGVEVSQIDGVKWAVGIRGFQGRLSRAVLLLIDGRSVYSPQFHGVYWEVQDTLLEDIDRIEVIRGPGGTIWGPDAVNGVINIITRNARYTRGALISGGSGNVNQGFFNMRYGAGNNRNFNYRVYSKASTTGPEYHYNGSLFDDQRRIQAGFRADWDVTGHDAVTFQGDLYDGAAGENNRLTSFTRPFSSILNQNADLSGGNILAHWKHTLSGGSDLQVQMYYDRVNRVQATQGEHRDTYDLDAVQHISLGHRNDVIWGLGARVSPAYLPEIVPTYFFDPDRRTDQLYSAFAQDELAILPNRLSFTIGAKFFHSSFSGFNTEPSVRLLWTPTAHQSYWVAATHAVRTPSDNEDTLQSATVHSTAPLVFTLTQGDGVFTSEEETSYEAGYRQLFIPGFSVDLATFYNVYNNLQSLEPGTPYTASTDGITYTIQPLFNRNGLKGTSKGFEIAPNWKPVQWWRLQGSYSFLDMDVRNSAASTDPITAAAVDGSSPRHQFGGQSFLDLPGRLEFTQIFRYVSALGAQRIVSYETADVRLAWRGVPHLEFAVTGKNLLQPHHFEFSGDPNGLIGIKRSIFATITWRK